MEGNPYAVRVENWKSGEIWHLTSFDPGATPIVFDGPAGLPADHFEASPSWSSGRRLTWDRAPPESHGTGVFPLSEARFWAEIKDPIIRDLVERHDHVILQGSLQPSLSILPEGPLGPATRTHVWTLLYQSLETQRTYEIDVEKLRLGDTSAASLVITRQAREVEIDGTQKVSDVTPFEGSWVPLDEAYDGLRTLPFIAQEEMQIFFRYNPTLSGLHQPGFSYTFMWKAAEQPSPLALVTINAHSGRLGAAYLERDHAGVFG